MVRPSKTTSETNRTASMLITSNQESRAGLRSAPRSPLTITGRVLWAGVRSFQFLGRQPRRSISEPLRAARWAFIRTWRGRLER
jgi:hypothetical protein